MSSKNELLLVLHRYRRRVGPEQKVAEVEKRMGLMDDNKRCLNETSKRNPFRIPFFCFLLSMDSSLQFVNHHQTERRAINRVLFKTIALFLWLVCLFAPHLASGQDKPNSVFEKTIAPILASRCVECHHSEEKNGGLDLSNVTHATKGGESGRALVPGNLKESLLWQRIDSDEMPPDDHDSLTPIQKRSIQQWISNGAPWPNARRINQYEFSTSRRAGQNWWSLQPVQRPRLPGHVGGKNPIDRFVGARLKSHGLAPSPPATKQVLIRRLYFGLLGLSPDPESVHQFIQDKSENAYEKLVDRLLASPRYGERWGRHWLDIAHYADTHGYERDQRRLNAWRYRDYVVGSFNQDRPYDEFVLQQIAGDVLDPDNEAANIATGFLACGPYDFTGNEETINETLRRQAIADDLDDLITTVLTSTMGLTVNCARCHNHKFDPISQKDYYELAAVFAGVQKKDRVTTSLEQFANMQKRKSHLNLQIAEIKKQLQILDKTFDLADIVAAGDGSGSAPGGLALDPRTGSFIKGNTGSLENVKVNQYVRGISRYVDGCFIPDGGKDRIAKVQITSQGHEIRLPKTSGSCWDYFQNGPCNSQDFTDLENVDFHANGHSLLSIHSNKGITFDLNEVRQKTGWSELRFSSTMGYGGKHLGSSADVFVYVDGKMVFEHQHVRRKSGAIPIDLTINDSSRFLTLIVTDDENGIGHDQVFFGDAWLRDGGKQSQKVENEIRKLAETQKKIEQQLAEILDPSTFVYAVVGKKQVAPTHLLVRGNPEVKGDQVFPAGLDCVSVLDSQFKPGQAEGSRRLQMAKWITDSKNPLTARVIVNRIWHYHFGRGLVNTPSDFGFLGGRPSHPDLLDWLASELMENGWSLKEIHRLIVTSATYRQSSRVNDQAILADADNQFLWRMNPRRLETEAIRDSILKTSGALNLQAGGPGYQDFDYEDKYAPVYKFKTADAPDLWRRTVYRFTVRSVPNRLMEILDCPNPSSLTPKRNETTTALQSLVLLNNPFMIDQAKHFESRLKWECQSIEAQVDRGFQLALSRPPTESERSDSIDLVKEHGLFYFCRALFNLNEFIYLD